MSESASADVYHVHTSGLPIRDGWTQDIFGRDAEEAAARNARLRTLLLERIVPQLNLIHREWTSPPIATPPAPDDIDAFGHAVLADDAVEADRCFQHLRDRGFTPDQLFETLLAPAARRFGELWEQDECDFIDVTLGVNRLRVMLETYANVPTYIGDAKRRALLISTPDERHRFGLDMIATFLRASGWDAVLDIRGSAEDNATSVSENWFAIVGLTITEEGQLETAARAIAAVRRASVNPTIAVIAGGRVLLDRPDLLARIGADATAIDGPSAALLAHKLYLAQTSVAVSVS